MPGLTAALATAPPVAVPSVPRGVPPREGAGEVATCQAFNILTIRMAVRAVLTRKGQPVLVTLLFQA